MQLALQAALGPSGFGESCHDCFASKETWQTGKHSKLTGATMFSGFARDVPFQI